MDSYVGIKEIYMKRFEVMKGDDAMMEEMKKTEDCVIIEMKMDS